MEGKAEIKPSFSSDFKSEKKAYPVSASDYKLLEEIGKGVSAVVYRAKCIPFNELVAIKTLDLERCNSSLDDIRREAQTMSLISHPNVVKANCSFVVNRTLWVVMPFMEGGSCLHIMKAAFPDGFEEPIIASFLKETLKALEYLHHHGYIHRDVKAGNILVGGNGAIKLGDFGVSAFMFDTGDRQRSRSTFVGTPCWMAPEVLEQVNGYDFKADVWSFGITALELAHGHAPFSKYPPMKVLLMTLQNAPPGLDYERDKRFSKAFKEMVAMCLVKDPSKRPSAEKLLKHSFFKHSRSVDYVARTILDPLPPLWERFHDVQLYDNEWSLIEDGNYRVLADSYFDQLESKETILPTRVTRNAARRAASNESMPTEIQRKELTPVISKPNKRVAFPPTTSAIGMGHLDCVRYEEKPTQLGNNHATAAISRQNKAPILGICDSLAYNSQLECVSYQETRPNDSKVSYQGTRPDDSKVSYQEKRGNEQSAYIEKTHPKKPRIEAAASSLTIQKPVYDMMLVSSVPTAPLRVKEEPVELPCLVEKRNDIVLREEPVGVLDTASPSYSLPAAIVSTCQPGKKAVSSHKHEESMLKNGDFKGRKASPSKEQSREISALITYPKRNEAKQEKDALSRIAATYGNMSDDELEAAGQDNDLPETNDSSFMKSTNAKTQGLESSLILKGKGVKAVTHIRSTMVVKEEPKVLFFITHSQHDSYTHNPDDISRGQEIVPIKLAKDCLNQSLPTSFYYIPKNITFQDAYVNFSLARIGEDDCCGKCYGDCLKRYPSCHCARETGGEFAYNSEGRLREGLLEEAIADKRNAETSSTRTKYCEMGFCLLERGKNGLHREPCKGHLIRKFVKECWSKCGCGMDCGNRVVQKGIRQKLEVFFTSKGKGWGVRTLEDLPAGTFVCEYIGEILTNIELDTRNTARKWHSDHYPVLLDADWSSETMLKDEELLCLDATIYGNVARFINHRCYDANLVDIPVEIESPDHHYYHVAFFTTRLVTALEELTWDYSIDFEDLAHPIKAFHCLCESQYCRGRHYKA